MLTKQIAEQQRIIDQAEQKKNKLLELVATDMITTANFKSMTANCDKEAEEAQKTMTRLEEQLFTKEEYRKRMSEIKTRLDAAVRDASSGMITSEFVAQYIDKILVTPMDDTTAKLDIQIFTEKNTQKWLQKLRARHEDRTGHMLKKMVESYENNLKTNG